MTTTTNRPKPADRTNASVYALHLTMTLLENGVEAAMELHSLECEYADDEAPDVVRNPFRPADPESYDSAMLVNALGMALERHEHRRTEYARSASLEEALEHIYAVSQDLLSLSVWGRVLP